MDVGFWIAFSILAVFTFPWVAKIAACFGAVVCDFFYKWYKQIVESWKEFLQFIGVLK